MRGSGRPPEKTSREPEYACLFHHAPSQTNFQDKHGSGEQEGGGYGEDHTVAEGGGGREADKVDDEAAQRGRENGWQAARSPPQREILAHTVQRRQLLTRIIADKRL